MVLPNCISAYHPVMGVRGAIAFLVLAADTAAMAAPCTPPPPVAAFLKAHSGWRILTLADLNRDQQMQWNEAHKAFCPGMAEVVVDSSAQKSWALALLDGSQEQLVLLHDGKPITLEAPSQSTGVVVWRAPPGKFDDPATGRKVTIAHDSIMYELFESATEQFYLSNGKVRRLQAGD
jgi:hypothetical protein